MIIPGGEGEGEAGVKEKKKRKLRSFCALRGKREQKVPLEESRTTQRFIFIDLSVEGEF